MQESDQMLLNSMKEYISVPSSITVLSQIQSEDLFNISLKVLQLAQVDISDIKAIQSQKFRSMTKLNQKMFKEMQIQIELNNLMSPTLPFIRKTCLEFITKLAVLTESDGNTRHMDRQVNEEAEERLGKKKILRDWMDDEWVHPDIIESQSTYLAYLCPLKINKSTLKANLIPSFEREPLNRAFLSILSTSTHKVHMQQKKMQAEEGLARKKEPESSIETAKLIASNFMDWNMSDQQLQRIKKRLKKQAQTKERDKGEINTSKNEESASSVFRNQVEVQIQEKVKQKQAKPDNISVTTESTDVVGIEIAENALQRIRIQAQNKKKQYDSLIQELLQSLQAKRSQLDSYEEEKAQLQQSILEDEEKLIQYKAQTDQLKKQVEKKQQVLQAVESDKPIDEDIQKYESDIKSLQQRFKQQVDLINNDMESAQKNSQLKLEALKQLKIKLSRIENQYKDICEEMQYKLDLKSKVKINKTGMSRLYYNKKISEIDSRWRDTQRQVNKVKKDLQFTKQKTAIVTDMSSKLQLDIHASMDRDKNKNEAESKALKEVFFKCQQYFKKTLRTLQSINDVKEETHQYQMKVHTLSSQNYKSGIQRVDSALADLKKQINEMKKKSK